MKSNYDILGNHVRLIDNRNRDLLTDKVLGINIDKFFMPSVANVIGTDLSKYKLLSKGKFACNPMHVGRDERLPVALYMDESPAIVSPAYFMFEVIDNKMLNEEFLMMWLRRPEFDRICWLHTDGSVRGGISWDDICRMELPIPPIEKQLEIVESYKAITDRIELKKKINDNLEATAYAIYKETFITLGSEKWDKGTLSDLLTVKYGKDHKHLLDGSIPLYGSGGIMRYVEKSLYDKVSVLIPRKGTLSNVIYVDEPFWSVDTMFYTEILKPYAAKFIYYFVKSKDLAGMDTGSAVPSMSSEIIHSMQLDIPDDETLVAFDNRLNPLYKQMKVNNQECNELLKLQEVLLATISSH
ncbi:MAG: restriction endonuclease subunit S [Flavobacteriaceae bacterium]